MEWRKIVEDSAEYLAKKAFFDKIITIYGRNVVSEALDISVKLKEWMQECFDIETRVTVLGHTQRGGNPTVYDRLMAYEFTTYALECEEKEAIIVYDNGRFETKKATCVIESDYQMDAKILDFVKRLSGVVRH